MLQTQCYGIQVSRYTRYKQTNKQTNKQTDYYNPWPPTRLGLTSTACMATFQLSYWNNSFPLYTSKKGTKFTETSKTLFIAWGIHNTSSENILQTDQHIYSVVP